MTHNSLAERAAAAIRDEFVAYHDRFAEITARARERFERRDWHGSQHDATERLALYKLHVDRILCALPAMLGDSGEHPATWMAMREAFGALIAGRDDCELAETFFNSLTRRVFATVGVEPRIEFLPDEASAPPPAERGAPIACTYAARRVDAGLVRRILERLAWAVPYRDLEATCERVAAVLRDDLALDGEAGHAEVDVLDAVFYRNKGAYIVGRVRCGGAVTPLVLALLNGPEGIEVDAVLTTADEASIVFGFSWSYFRVAAPRPHALVRFLASTMPLKRVDELYTAIGYNKHGKTELYRSIVRHMREQDARFDFAEGDEGLVMAVIALPSLNIVLKIIKDTFGQPKTTTRKAVMEKYHLVFLRDRAGRLADAQEFEHLELPIRCFPPPLLEHLRRTAGQSVYVEGDQVVLAHCYTERRVTPLNVYVRRADARAARAAILDYGNAIKDLAGANIFTGDMLLKNFGVTRHGRVIFYDYDELALLTECTFRRIPRAVHPEDEMAAEPWFYVGEHDVFPEEFSAFLVPPGALREAFLARHADLLGVGFWEEMQRRLAAGELPDVFPYGQERRRQMRDGG
ncbi:MAG TPA: bifunctional isocitrate dehydrogenase kinase/phosphatase [Gemmatimonadaceae bacterium]|nr:bifunctional isocitrate dehydrogenase kinase/phosphatase [Gemmatimonadaceae bacterium]